MDSDNLFEGLKMLQDGVRSLQVSRTIQGANNAVDQIRNSEADEAAKTQQLRGVAQKLTFGLAAQGVPGSTLDVLTKFAPREVYPDTPEQAILQGTPDQAAKGQALMQQKNEAAMQLAKTHWEAYKDAAQTRADATMYGADARSQQNTGTPIMGANGLPQAPTDLKTVAAFSKFGETLQKDESQRQLPGQAGAVLFNSQRLRALVGADTSDEGLNKIPMVNVNEAGAAMARLVQQGAVSLEQLKGIIPKNAESDKAAAVQYLTSDQPKANQAGLLKVYLATSQREEGVARALINDKVLDRAQANLRLLQKDPVGATQTLAKHLDTTPDQIIIPKPGDKSQKITTVQKQAQDDRLEFYMNGIKQQKMKLNSEDTNIAGPAAARLKALGIDPKMPLDQIQAEIKYRIQAGALE